MPFVVLRSERDSETIVSTEGLQWTTGILTHQKTVWTEFCATQKNTHTNKGARLGVYLFFDCSQDGLICFIFLYSEGGLMLFFFKEVLVIFNAVFVPEIILLPP